MLIIIAAWEAEILRIAVQGQPISKITRVKMDWRCDSSSK
jgi:hypothetical protein